MTRKDRVHEVPEIQDPVRKPEVNPGRRDRVAILNPRRSAVVGIVALLFFARFLSTAHGQGVRKRVWQPRRIDRGVSVAVCGTATFLTANFYDVYLPLRPGVGLSLQLGYRWNRYVQTFLALTYSEHPLRSGFLWAGRYGFLLAELQVVIPLIRWRGWRPAVLLGMGRAALSDGQDAFAGTPLLAGVQVEYPISRRLTIGAQALARYIDYTSVQYRLPTALGHGTVDGSNLSVVWLRVACHLGRLGR